MAQAVAMLPDAGGTQQRRVQSGQIQAFFAYAISVYSAPHQFGHRQVAPPGFAIQPGFVVGIEIDECTWHAVMILHGVKCDIALPHELCKSKTLITKDFGGRRGRPRWTRNRVSWNFRFPN